MPERITYRRLRSEDAHLILELHQSVFPPDKARRTIYASHGISRYLANLMALAELRHDHLFWGAWVGEMLVGYTHSREVADAWHLNYIAVAPDFRGQGIGSRMWEYLLLTARDKGYKELSLHIEEDNSLALDWYRRRGLRIVGETITYEKDPITSSYGISQVAGAGTIELADWEAAEAWQALYGFSQFRLTFESKTWTVDRLANHYFRLHEQAPVEIESVLHHIDPERRILLLSPIAVKAKGYRKIETTFYMKGKVVQDA